MFDYFEAEYGIERGAFSGELFGKRASIVDFETRVFGVPACDGDIPFRGVDRRNSGACLASGSDIRPVPQPISATRRPESTAGFLPLKLPPSNLRIGPTRAALNLCTTLNCPCGLHHSWASALNRAICSGSAVPATSGDDRIMSLRSIAIGSPVARRCSSSPLLSLFRTICPQFSGRTILKKPTSRALVSKPT
jgi:hypothetical protein